MRLLKWEGSACSFSALGNWCIWRLGEVKKKNPRSLSVFCILFPYMCNRFAQNIILKKQTKKLEKHEPIQISIKSPCLHPVFGPPFTPKPLFQPTEQKLFNLK
jgi:hypothetical protein